MQARADKYQNLVCKTTRSAVICEQKILVYIASMNLAAELLIKLSCI